jgi:hypothetical protein
MYPYNTYSLKMEIAKMEIAKRYIKLEIENEKKLNELIKNYKTKDPLLHKQYVKNIKKLLLKSKSDNNIVIKKNYKCFDQKNIIKNTDVNPGYSTIIYDTEK